jgi:hypothetical protein
MLNTCTCHDCRFKTAETDADIRREWEHARKAQAQRKAAISRYHEWLREEDSARFWAAQER